MQARADCAFPRVGVTYSIGTVRKYRVDDQKFGVTLMDSYAFYGLFGNCVHAIFTKCYAID